MDPRAVIRMIREGKSVSDEELSNFCKGLVDGSVSDAQAAAFAMAVCMGGLSERERVGLTTAMRDSGQVMQWQLDGPVLDKHSTGGVGDCVSLLLAPALAACGAYVPMISGRGLGHTGGTLDKLEAIPGLKAEVPQDQFRRLVGQVGCAIVSATGDIAPADKRLYAIRDMTATVNSPELITASILSKKLAAGLDGLVLDVKLGTGAFMKSMAAASDLAEMLVETANGAGCPTRAFITDMNQPLAKSLGNALEVMEVMQALTGDEVNPDLPDLAATLGGELLAMVGLADSPDEGTVQIADSLHDGSAAERFQAMVAAMGGPRDFVERWHDRLPAAPIVQEVHAARAGHVTGIDGEALGRVVVQLGGGRIKADDRIDPAVGLSELCELGDFVDDAVPVALIHARDQASADRAAAAVRDTITVSDAAPDVPPTVYRIVS
ncbi:MAG: thymidine phosphorylase [Pseudomonadota bacterium]